MFRVQGVLVGVALASLAFRPMWCVGAPPLSEDGYYSLSVARNLARGHGLTIDAETLTNGFQPLFTLIESLAFVLAGDDDHLALRIVLLFAWVIHLAGAWLIAKIAADAWPAPGGEPERRLRAAIAAFLWLAAPYMLGQTYNGLETSTRLLLLLVVWRMVQTGADLGAAGAMRLGAVLGLLVLARIDAGFFAVALAAQRLYLDRDQGWLRAMRGPALMACSALLVSSPWWLYNQIYFGSPVPISGTSQQQWGVTPLRIEFALNALSTVLAPWLFLGLDEPAWLGIARWLLVATLAGGAVWLWRDRARAPGPPSPGVDRTLAVAAAQAVALVALVAFYVTDFVAYWFYHRYFAPGALFAVLVLSVLAARARFAWPRTRLATAAIGVAMTAQAAVFVLLAHLGTPFGGNLVYQDQIALVRQYVPAADAVAAGQSGSLGFYRDRVVNVDGKVNPDVRSWQTQMPSYLRKRKVRWFADWPHYVRKYLGADPRKNGWLLVGRRAQFELWRYAPPASDPVGLR